MGAHVSSKDLNYGKSLPNEVLYPTSLGSNYNRNGESFSLFEGSEFCKAETPLSSFESCERAPPAAWERPTRSHGATRGLAGTATAAAAARPVGRE